MDGNDKRFYLNSASPAGIYTLDTLIEHPMYRPKTSSPSTLAKRLSGSYQASAIATSLVSPLLGADDQLGFSKQSSNDSAIQTVEQLGNCIRVSIGSAEA
jgi:hypothetical protein